MANEEAADVAAIDDDEVRSEPTDTPQADASKSPDRTMIDPRGPRFGAAITVVVLAVALITIPSITSVVLLVIQAIAFGAAALLGIQAQPYGWIYRESVAPRLRPPRELEDAAPPRFAQQVGLGFVLIALVGLAFSAPVVAQIATAFALAAAFLNAVFNFCLGCEMYLLYQRIRNRRARSSEGKAGDEAVADDGDVDQQIADSGAGDTVDPVTEHGDTEDVSTESESEAEAKTGA